MKLIIFILTCLLWGMPALYSLDLEPNEQKALLLPFEMQGQSASYPAAVSIGDLLFNSLYEYLSILPFIELPEKTELQALRPDSPAALSRQQKSEYLVMGSYTLSGEKEQPQVDILIQVWSAQSRSFILEESIRTTADLDIFDSIDRIASDSLLKAFNIKSQFAVMRFSGFQTGVEEYQLYINNKLRASVTNENFDFSLRILGDTPYKVVLRHIRAGVVYRERLTVPSGTVTNISYKATGTLYIQKLLDKDIRKKYTIYHGDTILIPGNYHEDFPAGSPQTLRIFSSADSEAVIQTVQLQDRQTLKAPLSAGHSVLWSLTPSFIAKFMDLRIMKSPGISLNSAPHPITPMIEIRAGRVLQPLFQISTGIDLGFNSPDKEYTNETGYTLIGIPLQLALKLGNHMKRYNQYLLGFQIQWSLLQITVKDPLFTGSLYPHLWDAGIFVQMVRRSGVTFGVSVMTSLNRNWTWPDTQMEMNRNDVLVHLQFGYTFNLW